MTSEPTPSAFARLALRMGIVSPEQLEAALGRRSRRPLEWVLLEDGLLTPELAQHVRDALRLQATPR